MKVAELSGPLLDLWVANALKIKAKMVMPGDTINGVVAREMFCATLTPGYSDWYQPFFPSTSWFAGGPIMEQHRVTVAYDDQKETERGYWMANYGFPSETMLVAAMRAIVAAEFGEEV
jgi:Protein of unknown function (DUF2591)